MNQFKELCECGGGAGAKEITTGDGTTSDEDDSSEQRDEIERQMLKIFRYDRPSKCTVPPVADSVAPEFSICTECQGTLNGKLHFLNVF